MSQVTEFFYQYPIIDLRDGASLFNGIRLRIAGDFLRFSANRKKNRDFYTFLSENICIFQKFIVLLRKIWKKENKNNSKIL